MAPDALKKERPKVKRKVKVKAEALDGDVEMLALKGGWRTFPDDPH
jgi:hypothetical protein